MLSLKGYLLSIISAALLVSIMMQMIPDTSKQKNLVQMIGGVFIVLTIVSPLSKIKIEDYLSFYGNISSDAQTQIDYGVESANSAIRQVIKEQAESYILEKAAALGAQLQAEVMLDQGEEPYPVSVVISGNISPYAKEQLSNTILDDIGIPKEMQKWT